MPGDRRGWDEREQHIAALERALLDGHNTKDAVLALCRTFNISESTADRDLREIRQRWKRKGNEEARELDYQFGLALARRNHMFGEVHRKADDESLSARLRRRYA